MTGGDLSRVNVDGGATTYYYLLLTTYYLLLTILLTTDCLLLTTYYYLLLTTSTEVPSLGAIRWVQLGRCKSCRFHYMHTISLRDFSSLLNIIHSPRCGFQALVDTALESSASALINEHLRATQWRVVGVQGRARICKTYYLTPYLLG